MIEHHQLQSDRMGTGQRWQLVVLMMALLTLVAFGVTIVWRFAWPAEQLAAAEDLLRQHNFPSARSRLDHYLLRWPGDKKALLLAARAAWQSNCFAEAERYVGEIQPTAPTGASWLEWALIGTCQGDFGDDENRLRAAVQRNDIDTSAVLEALAQGYQLACRWQDAQQALNQLIEREPMYAVPYVQRSAIRRRLGGPFESATGEQELRHAVTLSPANAATHGALAGALMDLGFVHEAMNHYERVLDLSPSEPGALLGLARALTDAAQLAEAERRLDALLAAHSDNVEGLVERGRLALRCGQAAAAAAFLDRAIRAAPSHRAGHQLYLAALKELGRGAAAANCETRLAELRSEDAAGARLQLSIQNAPAEVGLHWKLYLWCLRNGVYEKGFACLAEVLRLDPKHGPAHRAMADHFDRAGQPRRAAQHRTLAMGD